MEIFRHFLGCDAQEKSIFITGKYCLIFTIYIHIWQLKMEMQLSLIEVFSIPPSCFPAELPKTSSAMLFTPRAGCCRAKLPHPPRYLSCQGLSSQSHKSDRRHGLCGQGSKLIGVTQLPFQELGQSRSPFTTSLILLRQTWPGVTFQAPHSFYVPSVTD